MVNSFYLCIFLVFVRCNTFLENLIALELDFTLIPASFDATIMSLQNSGDNVLEVWMTAFKSAEISSSSNSSSSSSSSSYQKSSMLKSHLFLMLPLAVNLGTCRWITLQKTAHEIINVLNLPGFISNFNDLLRKLEQLEEENRVLKRKIEKN